MTKVSRIDLSKQRDAAFREHNDADGRRFDSQFFDRM